MTEDEEEQDVDSGWEAPVEPPSDAEAATTSSAERSTADAKGCRPTPVPDGGPSSAPLTVRVDVPRVPGREVARNLDDEPAPATRRAGDQEFRLALAVTAQGPSRKVTPVHGNAVSLARRLDQNITASRPTPPARTPVPPVGSAVGAKLRFPASGLDDARMRGRAATKVNFDAVGLAKASMAADPNPGLDLHLEGLDLGLGGSHPPASNPVSRPAGSSDEPVLSEPGGDLSSLELDDLPVDEMIESARPSSLPRRSFFPLSSSDPFPAPVIPRAAAIPTVAAVKRRLADGPALRELDDAFDDLESPGAESHISLEGDVALSEEEQLAILETEGEPDAQEADPLAVTAEAPAGAALTAYMSLSKESLGVSQDDPLAGDIEALRVRFERGDFMGVHMRVERLLEDHADYAPAIELKRLVQARLKETYKARLGSGAEILRVTMRSDEIQGLSLDHRAGFLMSLCDGMATIDDVVDMAGMDELDVLRLLYEMREQGVVAISEGR